MATDISAAGDRWNISCHESLDKVKPSGALVTRSMYFFLVVCSLNRAH
jgi:hypothetical protein